MSSIPSKDLERITQLALREFQKVLHEHLNYPWKPKHGRPPSLGYIERRKYSKSPWEPGSAQEAWSITPDLIEKLPGAPGPPAGRIIDGMFYDMLTGSFGVTNDLTRVSINWQTGPRFGRGFVHLIQRDPGGSIYFGRAQSTWMS